MKKKPVQLSSAFKTQASKAIFAICLFAFTYLIILLLAVILTGLCITAGIWLIVIKPMFLTIALGIGLASLGFLIIIFLLKFIFKSYKADRSHLMEITESQEPKLFSMIRDIVLEVETSFPKKVYLSSDVNASVFYDSAFWSMFLPVKKNLQIGLGLVNTVTKQELKAILSHEFGHFSQKTMKVGSYVYNVNQVIYNMLYENESYERLIQKWANISGYFSIFVGIAIKIIAGIQWILKKMYEVVNKSYMGLSREMEFHADEIAASVTGYEPLKNSLLRLSLADNSFNNVLDFYNKKIADNIKSENIFKDQSSILHFLADVNSFTYRNNLPEISLEEQSKFDKSKLVIKDQWASHPNTDERIKRLEETGLSRGNNPDTPANDVFTNIEALQKELTNKIFEAVSYAEVPAILPSQKFIEDYKQDVLTNSFSKRYNGYYDNKNPINFELNNLTSRNAAITFKQLYADEKVDWVYTAIALQNDMETLNRIYNKTLLINTFDYDGVRYKRKDASELKEKLNIELEAINEKIKINDADIYAFFSRMEVEQNKSRRLFRLYSAFFDFDKAFDLKYNIYINLLNELQFVNETTPYDQIISNFERIKVTEEILKQEIIQLLSDNIFTTEITPEIRQNLEEYTTKDLAYFSGESYFDEYLNVFYAALSNYAFLLSRKYFLMKKEILFYQEELMPNDQRTA